VCGVSVCVCVMDLCTHVRVWLLCVPVVCVCCVCLSVCVRGHCERDKIIRGGTLLMVRSLVPAQGVNCVTVCLPHRRCVRVCVHVCDCLPATQRV